MSLITYYDKAILITLLFSLSVFSVAEEDNAAGLFSEAQTLYAAGKYEEALPGFQKAVELMPDNSIYHHMLGKCHGRIAEHGSWFTALRNVGKTREEFKKAVELDENNIPAWTDLEEFYRRAPAFLGGDKTKAKEIREKLSKSSDWQKTQEVARP